MILGIGGRVRGDGLRFGRAAILHVIDRHFPAGWQFITATRQGGKVFVQVDESRSRELLPDARKRADSATA